MTFQTRVVLDQSLGIQPRNSHFSAAWTRESVQLPYAEGKRGVREVFRSLCWTVNEGVCSATRGFLLANE